MTMTKILPAENQQPTELRRHWKTVVALGVGTAIYAYRLGHSNGYAYGARDGYVAATGDIMKAWRGLTEELIAHRK